MVSYVLDIKDVLTAVYRLTANAAVQRGDADHVATEDNKDMLNQFLEEGKGLLMNAFGRYATPTGYAMPSNWPDRSEEVSSLAKDFLANYVTAKWFELNGAGDKFLATANTELESIKLLLIQRRRPI